jgi:hypothetical protein
MLQKAAPAQLHMQHRRPPIRLRLAKAILGSKAKEYIPALSLFDGINGWGTDATGRLKNYVSKRW